MVKKIVLLLFTLAVLTAISPLVQAQGPSVFGPSDFEISIWHVHLSCERFSAGTSSDGYIEITKNTPDAVIEGGFLFVNWQLIPLREFLSGDEQVFYKDIRLQSYNRLMVFLTGTPEASIKIEIKKIVNEPVPSVEISASPQTIQPGESTILSWSSTHADSASIDQGIGEVPLEGSITLSLLQTTTFFITATGANGTATASATIVVASPVPTIEITAFPETIRLGDSATLSWSATYADNCIISPDVGEAPINGSINLSPHETTLYTITAMGPGGSATAHVTITVIYPPSMVVVEPNGLDDEINSLFTIKWTDSDPNDDATISLYYDVDNSGGDGTLIVSGLREDPDGETGDAYMWDTTRIPEGEYYVYGVIDDGTNDPVVAYSPGSVSIVHTIPHEIALTPIDAAAWDHFGSAISMNGDYIIVGAPHDDDAGESSGSAYIFKRRGSTWVQEAKLTAADGAADDYFGYSVSITGDYAIVGAYGNDDGGESSGTAYIFRREGETWSEEAKLVSGDPAAYDYFGWSVAMDGDTAVVGAYGDDDKGSESGVAYVFRRDGLTWTQEAKLTAGNGASQDYFGHSLSISQGSIIIGAYGDDTKGMDSGAAYVFRLVGTTWTQEAKLTAADGGTEDYFGCSVAISGNAAIVGAYGDDDRASNSGAAYVFKRNSPWYLDQKLTAADGAAEDFFGFSVAASGNSVIVGAYGSDAGGTDEGAAYIFIIDAPLGSNFSNTVTASNGSAGDRFGGSVAISGPTAMVGASGRDLSGFDSGAIYSYPVCTVDISAEPEIMMLGGYSTLSWTTKNADNIRIDQGIGPVSASGSTTVSPGHTTPYVITASGLAGTSTNRVTVHVIDPSVPPTVNLSATDYMGVYSTLTWSSENADTCFIFPDIGSVALSGSMHVSPLETTTYTIIAAGPAGVVTAQVTVVFEPPSSYEVKIMPEDPVVYSNFGTSVCVSGDYAIVGSQNKYGYAEYYSGQAFIFQRNGANWNKQTELMVSGESSGDDRFGWSVAIGGDYAIVGHYGLSRATLYKRDGTTWSEQMKLISSDPTRRDNFGYSLSIDGDYAIVGAPSDDEGGVNSGAAYVFKRDGETWTGQAKLKASDAAPEDYFGYSVSISGDYCIIGTPYDDDGGGSAGAAYIYKMDGSTWTEQDKVTAGDAAAGDNFGCSVSISGGYAVAGAYGNDDGGSQSGAAYIFKMEGMDWIEQAKLTADDGAVDEYFGCSVSLDADCAIVGAYGGYGDENGGGNTGAAYIFKRNNTVWTEQAKLVAADGSGGDSFGFCVSIDAENTVVGARASDSGGTDDSGAAYIYHYVYSSVNISAEPEIMLVGESSTLSWRSSNADSISIDQGIGIVSSSGIQVVSPGQTTTYTITAIGPHGTNTDSVTVHVIDPTIPPTVNLTVNPEAVYVGVDATLTWDSTNATTCRIEPDIGDVNLSGSKKVTPNATTTYTITATGPAGTVTAEVTVRTSSLLPPNTLYPYDGEVLYRPDTLIQGQVINMSGAETSVTVNNIPAMVYGNQFFVNHVPLEEGSNTITVMATDTEGNTIETSLAVSAYAEERYVTLTADEYEGVSPFETKMSIEAPFDVSNVSLTYVGPGTVDTLDNHNPSDTEYGLRITGEGVYYFTAEVTDNEGNTYHDTIGVIVRGEETVDGMIKTRWNGMKVKLIQGDIQGALDFCSPLTINENEQIFTALGAELPGLVGAMEDIEKVYIRGCVAKYRIKKDEIINGGTHRISYYIYFVRDIYGVWRIDSF